MFIHSRCHNPVWDEFTLFSYRNAGGAPHPQNLNDDVSAFAPEPTDKLAWINHYSCKSAEEFILRRAKSPPECLTPGPSGEFFKAKFAQGFVDFFNQTDLPRDERITQCVPSVETEIDNLRGLPGVDAAMRVIEANYRESRRRLSEVLSVDPRFAVPGRPERWFADIIALDDEGAPELL
jgi:hypothetical protein